MPAQPPGDGDTTEVPVTRRTPGGPGTVAGLPVEGDPTTTGMAPTFPPALPAQPRQEPPHLVGLPGLGHLLGDFELLSVLGTGSFARVFLARQVSLGRQVALKVSADRGQEARTLASLEHDHIVRVFSEAVDAEHGLRLLCMQYVPGTTLERVIRALAKRDRRGWDGRAILEAVDELSTHPTPFDPAALRDREFLADCDFVEAACWIGARLAEALAHAHGQGVLHRDVKPANILLNRYGRPLLADFNIACAGRAASAPAGEGLGGTLAYMAPEHLDAFNPGDPTPPEAVDQRSDVYALGVVLFQLLTGRLPFEPPAQKGALTACLREMAGQRRTGPASPRQLAEVPEAVDRVVRRCLAPRSEDRYQSAADLARALDGCRELRRVEKELPPGGPVTRAALRHPFLVGAFLILLPHVLGSVVNVSYNRLRIVDRLLTPAQQETFARLVLGYNLVVYLAALALLVCLIAPVARAWRRLSAPALPDGAAVDAARRQALRLPLWAVVLSALGWLPGGLLFPLGLHGLSPDPVSPAVFGHFLVSFTVSGLIALTYSVFAVQFLVLRVLYPRLWLDAQDLRPTARAELRGLGRRLGLLQFLAVLIPLAGAVLMVGVGPEAFTPSGYRTFRLLVTALIALGMFGLGVAMLVSGRLGQTLTAFTGGYGKKS